MLEGKRGAIITTLAIGALAGAVLILPTLTFVGSVLGPAQPVPTQHHATPLIADAIWARARGGQATELQPINPFTLGRMISCHVLAEQRDTSAEREKEHDRCMTLMPGIEAVGYLSLAHMRSEGVWQDPRVPFVQIAQMTKLSSTWTRAELVDTLAERGEFGPVFHGVEAAARGYFARPASELTIPQVAMLVGIMGSRRADPWCAPELVAAQRHLVLERMRDNGVIDAAAFDEADRAALGVIDPPKTQPPCK